MLTEPTLNGATALVAEVVVVGADQRARRRHDAIVRPEEAPRGAVEGAGVAPVDHHHRRRGGIQHQVIGR